MVFSSSIFLFLFLPVALVAYWLVPSMRTKNLLLVFVSLVFYAWGEGLYVGVMLLSICMNFVFGFIARSRAGLVFAVAANVGLLLFFKYANFFVQTINEGFGLVGMAPVAVSHVHLPIGISFFTFQALSYVVDVYRREVSVQRHLGKLALYKSLFPQLIAGPIVRYKDIEQEVDARGTSFAEFAFACERFIVGLAKKVLLANTCGSIADKVFGSPISTVSASAAWFGAVCYTLQIYFDFSGYSDMAIGLGRMFGFHFKENFNYPYIASSLTDFWRRWHISLSTWFRDYVYIPMGGNRVGPGRAHLNLITVFFLCGLWHGAGWQFVSWGLWHGFFLILEKTAFGAFARRAPRPFQHAYTLLVVMFGWVIFRSDSLGGAVQYLKTMLRVAVHKKAEMHLSNLLSSEIVLTTLIASVACLPILPHIVDRLSALDNRSLSALSLAAGRAGALLLLALCMVYLMSNTYNPFIYYRF